MVVGSQRIDNLASAHNDKRCTVRETPGLIGKFVVHCVS